MQQKIKSFLLLGLIITSTIVGSITFADTAMAAPSGPYISSKVKNDAAASALRTAMALCLTYDGGIHMNGRHEVTPTELAKGEWFNDHSEPQARVGYIVDPDNGTVECRNIFEGRDVTKTLGWDSKTQMACDMGMKRANGSDCVNGDGFFTNKDVSKSDVYNAVDKKQGGNGYNGEQYYVLAATTYMEACDAKPIVAVNKANADQKNSGYDKVNLVDSKGNVIPTYFKPGNNDKHAYKNDENNFHYISENCDWMVDQMNKYANSYGVYLVQHPQKADDGATKDGESEEESAGTSCTIDGIGWILCPVMRLLSKTVDGAYAAVSHFLTVPPVRTDTSAPDNNMYKAWSVMRDFANVAFVIAFLIIIYSQLSNMGIGNYGIKKMLPRLIVAAILVNVSYWLCAIAVDVSNILGTSLKDLIVSADKQLFTDTSAANSGGGGVWDALTIGVITASVGAAAALSFVNLAALFPLLVLAALAIVTVMLVLTVRQALIVILIVISPLAFVAYLLPNTESLFDKWRKLFMTLLVMFPIIAIIFGGSQLASMIIMNSSQGDMLVQIIGAGVTVIPLFITPIVMKTAGGVLGKVGAFVNNPNRGPFDRMRKAAERARDTRGDQNKANRLERANRLLGKSGGALGSQYNRRRRAAAYLGSLGSTGAVNSERKQGFANAVANETAQEYFAKRALEQEGFASKIAGDKKAGGLKASAQSAVDKILHDDIKNREILLSADVEFKNNPQKALNQALESGDKVQASAAISMLMKTGASGYGKIYDSIQAAERAGQGDSSTMEGVRDFIKENGQTFKAKDPALTRWATQDRSSSAPEPVQSLEQMSANAGAVKKSDAEVAGFTPSALKRAIDNQLISSEQAKSILSNPNVVKDAPPENVKRLQELAKQNIQAPAPAPAPQRATGAYSTDDLRNLGPENIRMIVNNNGGGASNLSDGDIAKIMLATRHEAGQSTPTGQLHDEISAERDRRRGGNPGSGPRAPLP